MAIILSGQATCATAQSEVISLQGPRLDDTLMGHIDYALDATKTATLAQVIAGELPAFQPVTTAVPDFGYIKDHIWLRMTVRNDTDDIRSWRIHVRENFKQIFAVHILRESGATDTVFDVGLSDPFSARPIFYPEMVAPMELEPGETATVYITYWSEGASYLAFGFETQMTFAERAATRAGKNFLYYGMMLILVLVSCIALVLFRRMVFAAYIGHLSSAAFFMMHSDGVTFQYIWPNNPAFNSFASIPTGAALIFFAPVFARVFLNTRKYHPVVDKLLLSVILATVALALSSLFVDRQMVKKLLVLMSLISISMCAFSGIVAALTRFKEVRFYLFAWIGFLSGATIMSMRHWLGIEISRDFQHDFMRTIMVMDATLMGLSIADRYIQLRQSRQNAMQARHAEETRNLRLVARLSDLEKRYAETVSQVQSGDTTSADTLHDLQQPLSALRMNIKRLAEDAEGPTDGMEDVEGAFNYIEDLMTSAISKLHQSPASVPALLARTEANQDAYSLRNVTDGVFQMFLADAEQKGVELRYYPSQHDVPVEALPTMRILSNLMSNAVKFTDQGRIVLCVRKRGDGLRVEIHDSGPGLSAQEFQEAKGRNARLQETSAAEGLGLGLSIVQELASARGLAVERLCNRTSGFSVGVTFPMARSA